MGEVWRIEFSEEYLNFMSSDEKEETLSFFYRYLIALKEVEKVSLKGDVINLTINYANNIGKVINILTPQTKRDIDRNKRIIKINL